MAEQTNRRPHEECIRYISVPAVMRGDKLTLVDAEGMPISKRLQPECLGRLSPESAIHAVWRPWAKKALTALLRSVEKAAGEKQEWLKKASSLASSFRLRGNAKSKKRKKAKSESSHRPTWHFACHRMQTAVNAKMYRNGLDPWTKWSYTVSKNQNVRNGGESNG